jgi:TrpR-related protein YerC/YecD
MVTIEDWTSEDTTALFEAVLSLESVPEAEAFFRDLCTRNELDEMSKRWAVARFLVQGLRYREIAEKAHSSTATVTRINQWLRHGSGGYRLVLDRLGIGSEQEG